MDKLIVTADDFGYSPAYDRGILVAAEAEAIDAVSVMVRRGPLDVAGLERTGVELGLHLELEKLFLAGGIAGHAERRAARASLHEQLVAFEQAFGVPPAFLDGHHHCHAAPGLGAVIARAAAERGLPVRSTNPRHRRLLRCLGVATPDLLVGRQRERDPVLPAEVEDILKGDRAPGGVVEWMIHPGHPDASTGSDYDVGREADLRLLLELREEPVLRGVRATHTLALGAELPPGAI